MGEAYMYGWMDGSMKDAMSTIESTGKGYLFGRVDDYMQGKIIGFTKGNGFKGSNMEGECK